MLAQGQAVASELSAAVPELRMQFSFGAGKKWAGTQGICTRVVGGWAQRPDGEIVFRLLEDIGADGVAAVQTATSQLGVWLGKV
jgi:hypothetical protein